MSCGCCVVCAGAAFREGKLRLQRHRGWRGSGGGGSVWCLPCPLCHWCLRAGSREGRGDHVPSSALVPLWLRGCCSASWEPYAWSSDCGAGETGLPASGHGWQLPLSPTWAATRAATGPDRVSRGKRKPPAPEPRGKQGMLTVGAESCVSIHRKPRSVDLVGEWVRSFGSEPPGGPGHAGPL